MSFCFVRDLYISTHSIVFFCCKNCQGASKIKNRLLQGRILRGTGEAPPSQRDSCFILGEDLFEGTRFKFWGVMANLGADLLDFWGAKLNFLPKFGGASIICGACFDLGAPCPIPISLKYNPVDNTRISLKNLSSTLTRQFLNFSPCLS